MKISSPVEICNLALIRIEQATIVSLTDRSLQGQMCKSMYEQAKSSLLARYNWSFALKKAKLAEVDNTADPLQEYKHAYALPDDFLKIFMVYGEAKRPVVQYPNSKPPYVIESKVLLIDDSGCVIKYISDEDTVTKFSPLFINCLVLDMAVRLTRIFQSSSAYQQQLMMEYNQELANAKISDCQQNQLAHYQVSPLFNEYWGAI